MQLQNYLHSKRSWISMKRGRYFVTVRVSGTVVLDVPAVTVAFTVYVFGGVAIAFDELPQPDSPLSRSAIRNAAKHRRRGCSRFRRAICTVASIARNTQSQARSSFKCSARGWAFPGKALAPPSVIVTTTVSTPNLPGVGETAALHCASGGQPVTTACGAFCTSSKLQVMKVKVTVVPCADVGIVGTNPQAVISTIFSVTAL